MGDRAIGLPFEVCVTLPSRISFILKIRVERPEDEPVEAYPGWQGQITHIPSGEQRYVKSISEITDFIQTHLAALGVPVAAMRPANAQPWWKSLLAPFRRLLRQGGNR